MNSYLIISLLIIALSNFSISTFAGIVFASKWQKDNQIVCLYGDSHNTYERFGDGEKEAFQAFYNNLKTSSKEWLLLCEDTIGDKISENLAIEIINQEPNFTFLNGIKCFRHSAGYKISHVDTQNIDLRSDIAKIILLFDYYKIMSQGIPEFTDSEDQTRYEAFKTFYDNLYNIVQSTQLWDHLNSPVKKLFECVEKTSNEELKTILTNIINTLCLRQELLAQMGIKSIEIDEESFVTHKKIFDLISDTNVSLAYACETVEALTLWNIVEKQNTNLNIAVFAGTVHILSLEDYLHQLGYKKIASLGDDNKKLIIESEKITLELYKKRHELVCPLNQDFQDISANFLQFIWALKEHASELAPANPNDTEITEALPENTEALHPANNDQQKLEEFAEWATQQQEQIFTLEQAIKPVDLEAFSWLL